MITIDYVCEYGIRVLRVRCTRHRRSAIQPLAGFDPGGYHMLQHLNDQDVQVQCTGRIGLLGTVTHSLTMRCKESAFVADLDPSDCFR